MSLKSTYKVRVQLIFVGQVKKTSAADQFNFAKWAHTNYLNFELSCAWTIGSGSEFQSSMAKGKIGY